MKMSVKQVRQPLAEAAACKETITFFRVVKAAGEVVGHNASDVAGAQMSRGFSRRGVAARNIRCLLWIQTDVADGKQVTINNRYQASASRDSSPERAPRFISAPSERPSIQFRFGPAVAKAYAKSRRAAHA